MSNDKWKKEQIEKKKIELDFFRSQYKEIEKQWTICKDIKIAEKLEKDLDKIERKIGSKINELMDLGVKI